MALFFRKIKLNNHGSLLMEALLSVVILSVSVTLIIQSMIGSLRAMNYGAHYTEALMHAENKMFDYVSKDAIEPDLYEEDQLEGLGQAFRYEVDTNPLTDQRDANISNLNFKIFWSSRGQDKSLVLETYALKLQEE